MKAWAIKHWNGGLYVDTVRRTKREAIEVFKCKFYRGSGEKREKNWKDDSRYKIHRAVKVSVEISG